MENIHYITSCITEAFPDYKKVIDKKGETKYSITINIEKFLQFTKKLNNYKNNVISFEEDSEVRFMDNDFEVYEKDVFTFQGAFQRIGFNWKMLNDLLKILKKATKSEQVTLNLTTPTEPAFMCEQDLQILVMPMLIPLENQ